MTCASCTRARSLPTSPPRVEREYRWALTENGGWARTADFLNAVPPPPGYRMGATRTTVQGNVYLDSPGCTLAASGVSLSVVLGGPDNTWLVCKKRLRTSNTGRSDALEIECRVCPQHLPTVLNTSSLMPIRYLRHQGLTQTLAGYAISRQERDKAAIDVGGGEVLFVSVDRVEMWPVVSGRTVPPMRDEGIVSTVSRWLEIEWNGSSGPALTLLNQWAERITQVTGRSPARMSKSEFAAQVARRKAAHSRGSVTRPASSPE